MNNFKILFLVFSAQVFKINFKKKIDYFLSTKKTLKKNHFL